MPELTGMDLIRELRRSPKLAGVPVVVFSGYPRRPVAEEELAVADWLCKPASVDQVLETVRRFAHAA